MSEGLFTGFLITIGLVSVVIVVVGILMLRRMLHDAVRPPMQPMNTDPESQRQEHLLAKARKACGTKACCKCKNWDLDSGRAAIMQNPAFAMAARQLSPNRMGRKADDPKVNALPIAVDTWELFGVCGLENIGRHAIDVCDSFEKV
jgi:hypothetical protein